jgi:DNA uptake protein ComE-like DNA-binding protein
VKPRMQLSALYFLTFFLVLGFIGCDFSGNQNAEDQKQREEKTRDEAAKATEQAKPAIESAGKALGRAAEAAAEDAHAAAQGIREGWKQAGHEPLDLNAASERELSDLPGITPLDARRIIQKRPYRSKHELVTKGVLSETSYAKIRDDIAIK